jgi:hypothetical protein
MIAALVAQAIAAGLVIGCAVLVLAAAADRIGNRVWPKGGGA